MHRLKRTGVLLVEDSSTVRAFLARSIESDPRLAVVASAHSGEEALEQLERTEPDVISLDLCLPGLDGFEVARRVISHRPTPIVVCTSRFQPEELRVLSRSPWVVSVVSIRNATTSSLVDSRAFERRLCEQLVRAGRSTPLAKSPHAPSGRPVERCVAGGVSALGIVASTGGPQALCAVLQHLRDCPVPILLVQHITPTFNAGFARWLDDSVPLDVVEATAGAEPVPGRVYVAPAGRHLALSSGLLETRHEPGCNGHQPSGTVLLRSLAEDLGSGAAGVVLTGMGSDGAEGLLAIRQAGGLTIAQDEATSLVYGMPRAAVTCGAADLVLPLEGIGPALRAALVARGGAP